MKIAILGICMAAVAIGCSSGPDAVDQSTVAPQSPTHSAHTNTISREQAIVIACEAMGVDKPEEFLNVTPPFWGLPWWVVEYAHPLGDNWNVRIDVFSGKVMEKGRKPSR